jgi:hypothetical protein
MFATTPSRVRMRALTGSASRRHLGSDGAAIATVTPPRPSAVRARPGVGDVTEASI